jgi:hypothetical protein
MRWNNYINESIHDKDILKAVFFLGYPGAGKTTLVGKIKDGSIPVATINTDKWTEFYAEIGKGNDWKQIGGSVKNLTLSDLLNKVNGLFPLFIEVTGEDPGRLRKRVDFLRDIGYDVSLVVVQVDLETSYYRVANRNMSQERQVSLDFVKKAYDMISKSISTFKGIIPDNITIINKGLSDTDTLKSYNAVMKKLNSPINSEKGKILLDYMKKNGYTYYNQVPDEWKKENDYPVLDKNSITWFKN